MKPWLAVLLFVVVVLGPIGVGAFMLWHSYDFYQRAVHTTGTVQRVDRVRNPQSGDFEAVAFVTWADADGGTHERRVSGEGGRSAGDTLELMYDPQAPDDATTGGGGWGGLIVLSIGLGFLGIVGQAWWRSRPRNAT